MDSFIEEFILYASEGQIDLDDLKSMIFNNPQRFYDSDVNELLEKIPAAETYDSILEIFFKIHKLHIAAEKKIKAVRVYSGKTEEMKEKIVESKQISIIKCNSTEHWSFSLPQDREKLKNLDIPNLKLDFKEGNLTISEICTPKPTCGIQIIKHNLEDKQIYLIGSVPLLIRILSDELIRIVNLLSQESYNFTRHEIKIGRIDGSDIQLNSKSVSRNHATIKRRETQWVIEDNNSSNLLVLCFHNLDSLENSECSPEYSFDFDFTVRVESENYYVSHTNFITNE